GGVGVHGPREDARAEPAGLDDEHLEPGEDGPAAGAHGVGERVDVRPGLDESLAFEREDGGDAVGELVRALAGLDAPERHGLPGGGDVLELADERARLARVLERDGERPGRRAGLAAVSAAPAGGAIAQSDSCAAYYSGTLLYVAG